jgi:beta-lactam-binding protein with PASTA domain
VRCVVPRLRGKTLARARQLIAKGHCKVGRVRRAYSGRFPRGLVIAQQPKAGAKLARNARVNVVVSRGAKPKR